MRKTFLLTGGTGFLGSLFAVELIKRGDKVIFLGRSKNNESFRERIKKILDLINKDIDNQFHFPPDFIKNIAINFIKKFEENAQKITQ